MYFTSKGTGTIWRFKDDGATVSGIEAWVTRKLYDVNYGDGTQAEDWGTGIDNLTFDGEGNLWALQDGGRNNLWVIRPDHTPENPKLELFMTTPAGSEPTGLTFSPDFKYGFVSIQHPNAANASTIVKDAAGNDVTFNSASTIVFSRKQFLGKELGNNKVAATEIVNVFPNPFLDGTNIKLNMPEQAQVVLEVYNMQGGLISTLANGQLEAGEHDFAFTPAETTENTIYIVRLLVNGQETTTRIVKK